MTDESSRSGRAAEVVMDDLDELEDFFTREFLAVDVSLRPDRDAGFSLSLAARAAPGLAISTLTSQGHLEYATAVPWREQGTLVLSATHAGTSGLRNSRHDVVDRGGLILGPQDGTYRAVTENVSSTVVTLDVATVARYAAASCGIAPEDLRFHAITPRSRATAEALSGLIRHAHDDVLAVPELAANPLVVATTINLIAAATLTAFPNTAYDALHDPEATHPRGHVPDARVREALDYLDAHADRPITPGDAAEHVDLPTRLLDTAMRRRRGHPAAVELWLARLRGAHRDLQAADTADNSDTAASVAAIAARWGFTDPRTFSVAYTHTTGGDTPEDTLRR